MVHLIVLLCNFNLNIRLLKLQQKKPRRHNILKCCLIMFLVFYIFLDFLSKTPNLGAKFPKPLKTETSRT